MKRFFLRIAIRYVREHIIDCKIRWDFIESPIYRNDLDQCIKLLETIGKIKPIDSIVL